MRSSSISAILITAIAAVGPLAQAGSTSSASAAGARQALAKIGQGGQALLSVNSKGNKSTPCPQAAAAAETTKEYESMDSVFEAATGDKRGSAPAGPVYVRPQYDANGRDKDGFVKPTCDPQKDGPEDAKVCTVSEDTAKMLFSKLAQAKDMLRLDNPRLDVCFLRAQVASYRLLMNYGVTTGKMWVKGNLNPQLAGEKGRSGAWTYHVASYINVKRDGKTVRLVLDPIVDNTRPLTEDEWKSRITSMPSLTTTSYSNMCTLEKSELGKSCSGAGLFYNEAVKRMNGHETDLAR